jgi:hypothetical protein
MKLRVEELFLRYGAGSKLFLRIIQSRHWNVIAWTTIVVGALAWVAALLMWNY